ncbi:TonB-dependent receptor plug domain-containing protein [Parerythrobacter jejuensis]|uniref:TonB-dependent receptor n=1 Tax=Parerythrobacter jejuensis TaxID=795812 RepID=A0A845APD7_9SPHN|nr:TonB-dependent receptor [Parerythrobacter jejuensis]MXP32702.1 TonB-dependent receptor [Parerythrobacter jejuensis]
MRKYLLLLSCAVVSLPVSAQDTSVSPEQQDAIDRIIYDPQREPGVSDDPVSVEPIVGGFGVPVQVVTITVTGTPIEVEDTGQPVTIIQREEIEQVQGPDLTRLLRRAPGVTISRNGGVGGFTGVRVRGAEAEQLLVLVDGVRVNDPSSPAGGFDFGNLLPGTIAQIDLLRGSNSTVWGSDALGGVMAVRSRAETGLDGSVEYGARDTLSVTLAGGVEGDTGFLGLAGGYYSSDGFSAAASGTEPDGFEQFALSGRGRLYLSDTIELFASGRYAEGELEIDGFPFPTFTLSDTAEFQETTQYSASVGIMRDAGPLFVQAAYSFADTQRANFDPAVGPAPGFTSDGHSDRIDVKGEWRPIGPVLVNFGADAEWTSLETNFTPRQNTRIIGGHVQLGIEFGGLSGHLGLRQDDHARFGSATSFGADISYEIATDLRVKASIGEGFKAPSLFQLFSDFGNDDLVPEKSTSFDLGLAWKDRSAPAYASATLYRRDSEDLIQFVSCFGVAGGICTNRPFGTYDNVAQARAQGIELEAGVTLADVLQARVAYAYIDTEDRSAGAATQGNRLARRPRHAFTGSLDWTVGILDRWDTTGLSVGADIRIVSSAFDDAFNATRLDNYLVFDLRAELPVAELADDKHLVLFGRVENLFDEQYQTAAGYGQAGRGVFGGVRFGF